MRHSRISYLVLATEPPSADTVPASDRPRVLNRSYDRDTTKGDRADAVPIARELLPYLEAAIARSPSDFAFPKKDGSTMLPETGLEHVLRRALGRAGIITGYRY